MSIVFMNDGEVPIEAITTLGISVKEDYQDSPEKFGKFGTGAANAIAILLRNGQHVMIHSGRNTYVFSTVRKEVRGRWFEFVTLSENGRKPRELGFTTELGKYWAMWQAYRELYCNAVDEKHGQVLKIRIARGSKADAIGKTLVIVNGREFEDLHNHRHTFILSKSPSSLIFANNEVEIYEGQSYDLFLRNIKVKDLNNPSKYTYNFKIGELTEDRTLKEEYTANIMICRAWIECNNNMALENVLAFDESKYEKNLYWQYASYGSLPEVFKEAFKTQQKTIEGVSATARELYYREVKNIDELFNVITLTKVEEIQYTKALNILKILGLVPEIKFEVIFVDSLGDGILGQAKDKKIIINRLAFSKGTKEVVKTIYEEYLHCEHGYRDMSRAFQNHLFDAIMDMGEKLIGEPM